MLKSGNVLLTSILLMMIWNGVYTTPLKENNTQVEDISYYLNINGIDGNTTADINVQRRDKIQEMMKHAWQNYVLYAWGENELRPITKQPHHMGIFQDMLLGTTILEALDTLYIMGMKDEFLQARDWVATKLDLEVVIRDVPVYEVTNRLVGGLLACFALTGDVVFRNKAEEFADKLLPAFDTPTGIPKDIINFTRGSSKNYNWAGGSSVLSYFGGLHLEMSYLSDITGKPIYKNSVERIRKVLRDTEKPDGLYPNYLNPMTGEWGIHRISTGDLGGTFYEYLLKAWLQTNKEDNETRQMFDEAMQEIFVHLLRTSPSGLMYFGQMNFDRLENMMDQISCSLGGLLGLAANTEKNQFSQNYMEVAEQITETCHYSYNLTSTTLGPNIFRFVEAAECRGLKSSDKYYILRPEVIETYFIMYRITKDPKYREWGWEVVQALEKYCRIPGGYTGLKNVYSDEPKQDDVQQSFFLGGTLKYLYLLFSDDNLIPLDEWVFNTEGHPLPIKNVNPHYRISKT